MYDPLTLARARVLCEPFQLRFRTDAHQEEPHKAPLLLMSVARGLEDRERCCSSLCVPQNAPIHGMCSGRCGGPSVCSVPK